jgi:hypothetical protein
MGDSGFKRIRDSKRRVMNRLAIARKMLARVTNVMAEATREPCRHGEAANDLLSKHP